MVSISLLFAHAHPDNSKVVERTAIINLFFIVFMPLLLNYIILTDWEYGQNFDANVKSNVFKLEERPYFDEICAHSWSEIRVGPKKCPYCSDFCSKYVDIFTKIRASPNSCLISKLKFKQNPYFF